VKRELHLTPKVEHVLGTVPDALHRAITRELRALVEDPRPPGSALWDELLDAYELRAGTFTAKYTYGETHVSVWVIEINT
jgi:hypothetical protein